MAYKLDKKTVGAKEMSQFNLAAFNKKIECLRMYFLTIKGKAT